MMNPTGISYTDVILEYVIIFVVILILFLAIFKSIQVQKKQLKLLEEILKSITDKGKE